MNVVVISIELDPNGVGDVASRFIQAQQEAVAEAVEAARSATFWMN